MLKSSLCDYIVAYILAKRTITITPAPQPAANPNNNHKELVLKHYALFTDCISEINSVQIDNAKDIDVVMQMHNLIKHSNNYSKTS